MKSKFSALLILVIFILGGIFYINNKIQAPQEASGHNVHLHAGFVVFKDNEQVDFSDPKYMLIKPCNLNKVDDEEDPQIEKAHLHDQIGDVVHVEEEDAMWKDLFTNLKYNIDYSNVTAYLNGKKVDNFQELPIGAYDSLVVLIGKNDEKEDLSKAVTKDHIIEAEKRSENCGS